MKISDISVADLPPIKRFAVDTLSDIVVFAGPNGVGKTRLLENIRKVFEDSGASRNVRLVIEPTSQAERDAWGKNKLDTSLPKDRALLAKIFDKYQCRYEWGSTVIFLESDRTPQQISPYQSNPSTSDPWTEKIAPSSNLGGLKERFKDTRHSIFRKIQSERHRIAQRAEELQNEGKEFMKLDFPDPLEPFKAAFNQLLGPKQLLAPDVKQQKFYYKHEGQNFELATLSSGEMEVANLVFDLVLRKPSHSIIIFDEPELHLHPELLTRLIQTLYSIGDKNQFIFSTHSADLISSSFDHSLVLLTWERNRPDNQAIQIREDGSNREDLKLLGGSLGIISLGKNIVLIEGDDSSLDKKVYGKIISHKFPEFVLVPVGGKGIIGSFATLDDSILKRTFWGVNFFAICDRDIKPLFSSQDTPGELEEESHRRVLKRYHLENYFLEERVLANIFSAMEESDHWLTDPEAVAEKLKEIARSRISSTCALFVSEKLRREVSHLNFMPKACNNKTRDDLFDLISERLVQGRERVTAGLNEQKLEDYLMESFGTLEDSFHDNEQSWKRYIPGKEVFSIFASAANIPPVRLKKMYIEEAEKHHPHPFSDIIAIFEDFRLLCNTQQ